MLLWLVGMTAALVLIVGWGFGVESVRQLHSSFAAMAPSTALCFLIGAGSLIIAGREEKPEKRRILIGGAVIIAVTAAADLAIIMSGAANGVDMVLQPGAAEFKTVSMAVATATCFLLFATALVCMTRESPGAIFVCAATAGLILSSVAVTGYVFDASALVEVSVFTAMALHTAAAFVLLFSAVLMLRPATGWVFVLTGEGGGSESARRLFPGAIILPFALCLIALMATNAALFDANFRLSVLAIAMMTLLSAAVFWYANVQNKVEHKLRDALADRDVLIREIYHRVKNNLQMTTALLMTGANRVSDDDARELLLATTKRIEALGAVHRLLIASRMPSNVSADVFLKELCENIFTGQSDAKGRVRLDLEADQAPIHIDLAVSLGLIANELVTNALKYAFTDRAAGVVTVRFRTTDANGAVLTVADNGIGATTLFQNAETNGVGARIVQGLVRQLGATMSVAAEEGTVVVINIPTDALKGELDG